jgi:hypothetical protein
MPISRCNTCPCFLRNLHNKKQETHNSNENIPCKRFYSNHSSLFNCGYPARHFVYSSANNASCLATRKACKLTSTSKTTSYPYSSSYGVSLVAPCFETLCAHKASDNTSCHHRGVVSIFFLMSLISTLLLSLFISLCVIWH